jgi:hypothetical protein
MQTLHLRIVIWGGEVVTMDYPHYYTLEDLTSEMLFAQGLERVEEIAIYALGVAGYRGDKRFILHTWARKDQKADSDLVPGFQTIDPDVR